MADDFTAKPGHTLCNPLHNLAGRLWQTLTMIETVARTARNPALRRAQSDGGMVLSVFMVQTIAPRPETLCPESGTRCRGDRCHVVQSLNNLPGALWHSSYGRKCARHAKTFCVMATQNDAGESAITKTMNGASVTPLSLPETQNHKLSNGHKVSALFLIREREFWGMTLTPPAKASPGGNRSVRGNETGAIPAANRQSAGRRTGNEREKRV
jgi:hypothetical protein